MPHTNPSDDRRREVPAGAETGKERGATTPREAEVPLDVVDDAGMASFPASDPPGWNRVHAGAPRNTDSGAAG